MAHRTQITLTDAQYAALKRKSERSGLALAELVRRALDASESTPRADLSTALERSFGAWAEREVDGAAYVERLRRPGLGRRLRV
jgi:predicted DNA-binding ribbon-helix-helix protein